MITLHNIICVFVIVYCIQGAKVGVHQLTRAWWRTTLPPPSLLPSPATVGPRPLVRPLPPNTSREMKLAAGSSLNTHQTSDHSRDRFTDNDKRTVPSSGEDDKEKETSDEDKHNTKSATATCHKSWQSRPHSCPSYSPYWWWYWEEN